MKRIITNDETIKQYERRNKIKKPSFNGNKQKNCRELLLSKIWNLCYFTANHVASQRMLLEFCSKVERICIRSYEIRKVHDSSKSIKVANFF